MEEIEKLKLRLLKENPDLQFYDKKFYCKKQIAIRSKRKCGDKFRGKRLFCRRCSKYNERLEEQTNKT